MSEEAAKVLDRFARVFGQTYRRFRDLQKAEEQTREAKIEASLRTDSFTGHGDAT